jgi:hypothetical protein
MTKNPAVIVLEQKRDDLAFEIDQLKAKLAEKRGVLRFYDDAIEQLGGGTEPEETVESNGAAPTLKQLIIDSLPPLVGSSGTTPGDIARQITSAGRVTKPETVSSYLTRLKKMGIAIKKKGRFYRTKTAGSLDEADVLQ